jgi:hypothetical protein
LCEKLGVFVLNEESKFRIMENMILWGIFRHGREKMSRKLRKLHNEKLLNF